jgi:hypothetical protein
VALVRAVVACGLVAVGCGAEREITLVEPDAGVDAPVTDGPKISQVLIDERFDDGAGGTIVLQRSVFGEPLDPGDDGEVTGAVVRDNRVIIELDQPLRASRFWVIFCNRGSPNFDPIPDDATVDDIARCTPPDLGECTAFCADKSGIVTFDDGSPQISMIKYAGENEGPDDVEFGVRITCEGVNVPISGSGTTLGLDRPDGLLEVQPPFAVSVPYLRTSSMCAVSFHDEVVGFDDKRVCAPPGGDVSSPCSAPGVPIRFQTGPMIMTASDPADGEVDVGLKNLSAPMDDKTLLVQFNLPVAETAGAAFALTENGAPRAIEVRSIARSIGFVEIDVPGGLAADASYTLSFGEPMTDKFGGPFPGSASINFTAAAAPPTPTRVQHHVPTRSNSNGLSKEGG